MDTERNLLFGVVAFQNGAVDADGLAETCAAWNSESTLPLADMMVDRGLMTVEQKTQVERAVERELASYGGDPHATLVATIDGRSLEAMGEVAGSEGVLDMGAAPQAAMGQGGHVVLGSLSPAEAEARERYTLTHLHAKGGMGRVWLARDGSLGRQIALKELRPDQSDNSIVCSRFLYEAKITAQLEHPGIVPVYELGEGDAPYYTMRFVRGRTLTEATRAYHKKRAAGQADSVELNDLLLAFVSVCNAVAYAHSRGIIHRDLKGQNIVLGDFGEHIVLDWGLAKRVGPDPAHATTQEPGAAADAVASDRLLPEAETAATCAAAGLDDNLTLPEDPDNAATPGSVPAAADLLASGSGSGLGSGHGSNGHPGSNGSAHRSGSSARPMIPESGAGPQGTMQGQLLGTPAYMAPEQAQARHDLVDQRTDIYGLGAILYEILTGRPPFVAPKTSEVIRKVCQEAPTPPRQIVPEIAPGLEAVCLKAIRKEKADRYQSASELAQEVRRHLADEPVKAFAEPWRLRAERWMRRNRTKVAAAAGLLIAGTIALGVSTVLVSRERNEAETQGQQAREAVHLLVEGDDMGFDDPLDVVQKEKLEKALTYFEKFTSRAAGNPALRLEHGQAHQQMGDLQRKLGRLGDSEAAYVKAIALLEPLTGDAGVGRESKRSLARTRTLLGDLLVRRGTDKGRTEPLYAQALEAQQALADPKQQPAPAVEDLLRLGQTDKSRGDLLRLDGRRDEAAAAYDRAIAELERALAADSKHAETRTELALTVDARGWIDREQGRIEDAEKEYRRAIEMLEKLVADLPTVPRHREALARALNSLGMIERDTGRLADAEVHYTRELEQTERLARDFPVRAEYRRVLARSLSNLGLTLADQHRNGDAEPILRRSVEVNAAVSAASPDDVQVRFDLARIRICLGDLLREKGDIKPALESLRAARAVTAKMAKDFPDQPRYRELLAQNLQNLAIATLETDPAGADQLYRDADGLFDELIAAHPDMVDYRIGKARCLLSQGWALAAIADKNEQGEAVYRRGLDVLAAKGAPSDRPEWRRLRADILTNLGDSLAFRKRLAEAEPYMRQAAEIFEPLASARGASLGDRYRLAVIQCNLGENLLKTEKVREAEPVLDQSVAGFERVAAAAPESIEYRSGLGQAQHYKADCLVETGKLPEAATLLARAVENQQRAVELSGKGGRMRRQLADHLLALARVDLKRGVYKDAAANALWAARVVPDSARGEVCFEAGRILAGAVKRVGDDPGLVPADRDRLTRPYVGRVLGLLRDAIDTDPKLAAHIQADPDIKSLESRPEFKTMLNSLVEVVPGR